MARAGRAPRGADAVEHYLERGAALRGRIDRVLPRDWSWTGRRALDFGCGAGRVLRHFLPEAERAELWGCDIDREAIAWLRDNLVPPLSVFEVGEEARLPLPDGSVDAIWALSVFSHLHRDWASWLLELRRVLADDGYLIATFLGSGMRDLWQEVSGGEPYDEDRLGIAAFRQDAGWDQGGPVVFASQWWIRAHWGRAFEVERLEPHAEDAGGAADQGLAVLRKRPGTFTPADLERPEPDEPRETIAALHDRDRLGRQLDYVYATRSWRLTGPLRRAAGLAARARAR